MRKFRAEHYWALPRSAREVFALLQDSRNAAEGVPYRKVWGYYRLTVAQLLVGVPYRKVWGAEKTSSGDSPYRRRGIFCG
jgi:hypothetical protein